MNKTLHIKNIKSDSVLEPFNLYVIDSSYDIINLSLPMIFPKECVIYLYIINMENDIMVTGNSHKINIDNINKIGFYNIVFDKNKDQWYLNEGFNYET